mgnify:CR=1 FL=1
MVKKAGKEKLPLNPLDVTLANAEEIEAVATPLLKEACFQDGKQNRGIAISKVIKQVSEKYAEQLENSYSNDVLKQFLRHLKNRMPTKEEFRNTFKLIGYSNHCEYYHDNKNRQRAEMALRILEQIKSGCVDVHSFTLEHILPDSQAIP